MEDNNVFTEQERKEVSAIIGRASLEIAAFSIRLALRYGKNEGDIILKAARSIDMWTKGINDAIKGELTDMVKAVLAEHDLGALKR